MDKKIVNRCSWVTNSKIHEEYHDKEWGVPVYDDQLLYEILVLESFHTGFSWLIILKKIESFRIAFDNFNSKKIEAYNEEKIEELVNNEKIIRSRRKIIAAINNTKIFHDIQQEFGSFANYIWGFTNNQVIKNKDNNMASTTEISNTVSKDLKKRGMKYVGSVTINAFLEAIGVFNNHEISCFLYDKKHK